MSCRAGAPNPSPSQASWQAVGQSRVPEVLRELLASAPEKALIGSLIAVIRENGEAFIFEVPGCARSSCRELAVAN